MERKNNRQNGYGNKRTAARCTVYNVSESSELMDFLMKKMDGISRTRVKALLTNRVVMVDNRIQT